VAAAVAELKAEAGPPLLTQGSSELIQTLLANDLIDELRLVVAPIVLGKGKRLFGDGAIPAAFRLTRFAATPGGVLIASYERAGDVRTGSFAMEQPTEAELERRRRLGRG
jgi:dihydrofolate reductase